MIFSEDMRSIEGGSVRYINSDGVTTDRHFFGTDLIYRLKESLQKEDDTFSVASDLSHLESYENILDLKIDRIKFQTEPINRLLGIVRPATNQVKTLTMIEFYDHQIVNTNLVRGYKPEIQSVFSFKNPVDEQYL